MLKKLIKLRSNISYEAKNCKKFVTLGLAVKRKDLLNLAEKIENSPLEDCGPSDDIDKQYAFASGFRDLSIRFISAVERIGDHELSGMLEGIDTDISDYIVDAHKLKAKLIPVIDAYKAAIEDPDFESKAIQNGVFIHFDTLEELRLIKTDDFDITKLVRMCEELNDSYNRGNLISSILLLRAILNHVPPIFGKKTFAQVVASSGRSAKNILGKLEDDARPIADFHNHILIRKKEHCPTISQLDPYKSCFEVLIQEIITLLHS